MDAVVADRLSELRALCARRRARRLAVFGSAVSGGFDPSTSDLDFVVEFEPLPPAQHADSYFRLCEDLEGLFGRPVDVVELAPIRNPYLLAAIHETQVVVYEAP
jgi:predicted nucleotidyltransferase